MVVVEDDDLYDDKMFYLSGFRSMLLFLLSTMPFYSLYSVRLAVFLLASEAFRYQKLDDDCDRSLLT